MLVHLACSRPPVHRHGFCIRGTTEFLMAGVAPEVVAHQGGWTSLAFLLYWWKLEEILPMNITDAYKKKRLQELALEMNYFCSRNNILIQLSPASLLDVSYPYLNCQMIMNTIETIKLNLSRP
jgi:hypothetical protein